MIDALRDAPEEFEFAQAVRLLEAHARRMEAQGGTAPPLRFRNAPALAYPRGEIAEVRGDETEGWELRLHFLGLLGVVGTLPTHYTELVLARRREKDETLLEFLDILQQRAAELFLAAWRKYRFAFDHETRAEPCRDDFSRALLALCGHGASEDGRSRVAEASRVFASGLLSHRPRSAVGLECLLADYFGVPVRVEELVGHWIDVPAEERSRLGSPGDAGALGRGFLLGTRVWDIGSRIRLRLGPVDPAHFRLFLPGGEGSARLAEWTREYLGPAIECELVVEPEPGADTVRLGGVTRLGHDAWLASSTGRLAPATLSLGSSSVNT